MSDAGREELIIAVEADHEPPRAVMDRIMKEFSAFDTVRCITLKSFPRTAAGTRKIKRAALRQFVFAKSGAGVP